MFTSFRPPYLLIFILRPSEVLERDHSQVLLQYGIHNCRDDTLPHRLDHAFFKKEGRRANSFVSCSIGSKDVGFIVGVHACCVFSGPS